MILIFDTETTGLPRDWKAPLTDSENWPRLVQLAWQLHEDSGVLVSRGNSIVCPDGFTIPYNAAKIHGISTERALKDGLQLPDVMAAFQVDLDRADFVMGHNVEFDVSILGAESHRLGIDPTALLEKPLIDSKNEATDFCAIPGGRGGSFKWPTLTELHFKLFAKPFADSHDAAYDVDATAKCLFALMKRSVVQRPGFPNADDIRYEGPVLEKANFDQPAAAENDPTTSAPAASLEATSVSSESAAGFGHLHVHSQYSILQAVSSVQEIVATAAELKMPAVSMTDHGNMMGAFHFLKAAKKAGITGIVGIELNVCRDHTNKTVKDDGFPTVFLAKSRVGYHKLAKLTSKAFTNGFYYVPRVDRELVLELLTPSAQEAGDVLVLTGGLFGEVPSLVLNVGEKQAEEAFVWWKEHFGGDFYAELNRHGLEEEDVVNRELLRMCKTHGVRAVAANNAYYSRANQADAHDILLCVKDAQNVSKPKRYVGKRGREFRFGLPNDSFFMRPTDDMCRRFSDLPDAIQATADIIAQCESYTLERDVLLPNFDIPESFVDTEDANDGGKRGENAYLRYLTYVGAHRRYIPDLDIPDADASGAQDVEAIRQALDATDKVYTERIDFELETIAKTGYPGYFLIVQDLTTEARRMGVSVGPGRGSAAGSAVAYCVGITNLDPVKYDLLFERFLNPDRVSLPDIDIDFDDEGRGRVIQYVIDKYGSDQVAQIITYGTMGAKSSLRDTARVLELPLVDADRVAKLMPDLSLKNLFSLDDQAIKSKVRSEGLEKARAMKKLALQEGLVGQVIETARAIEGSVRNVGIHACGVIITPHDITEIVPVATAKDSDMVCTQFDNSVVEDAGLLKMDFLGLKTLTIIKDACRNVKERHGLDLDPDAFPLDDVKTYELFQRGDTVGIFQYESAGMQKYLKELKPTEFADLIAMNALYRPGPLEYIPSFVRRKHGQEPITYDLDACEEYLKETYGITVYQEQVMLLSQKLAGFTKGEADTLRKAMGKKKADLIDQMKPKFLDQGAERGHAVDRLEKIWKDWEAFASYAFNKSHSTCYAWVAYQTAYLKANYTAEFMAAVLSNNMSDIKQVTLNMEEARHRGIAVLGPCINESAFKFRVNDAGAIRFGLGAMRGVGEGAVEAIVAGRTVGTGDKTVIYASLFDFARRVSPKDVNKRVYEALALGGGFDGFQDMHRAQFFAEDEKGRTVIEMAARYGAAHQDAESSAQASLFGGTEEVDMPEPPIPLCAPWDPLDALSREKEVVGVYISGHPLDKFRFEMKHLCSPAEEGLQALNNMPRLRGRELRFAGHIVEAAHRISKAGKPFGSFTLEDYHHSERFMLFGEDYLKMKDYLVEGWFVFVRGSVEERRFPRDSGELEFKVRDIELLADVREKMVSRIHLQLNVPALDDTLCDAIIALPERHPGSVGLSVELHGVKPAIPMTSRSKRVAISDDFIAELERLVAGGAVKYKFDFQR